MRVTLREFFLVETDEDDPFAKYKQGTSTSVPRGATSTGDTGASSTHNMPGGMHKVKPQMAPPRSTPSSGGPPQKRVDPATEFLRSKGALGGLKGPGSGIRPQSDAEKNAGARRPGATGSSGVTKPNYPGSYIGQSVNTGGRYVTKSVSYQDKDSDDPDARKYGRVQSKVDQRAVWNGKDWVSPEEWARSGKKEAVIYPLKEFFVAEAEVSSIGNSYWLRVAKRCLALIKSKDESGLEAYTHSNEFRGVCPDLEEEPKDDMEAILQSIAYHIGGDSIEIVIAEDLPELEAQIKKNGG